MPDAYGIDDKSFPAGFAGQMAYPFRHLLEDWHMFRKAKIVPKAVAGKNTK